MARKREEISGKYVFNLRDKYDNEDFRVLMCADDLRLIIMTILRRLKLKSLNNRNVKVKVKDIESDIFSLLKAYKCQDLFNEKF